VVPCLGMCRQVGRQGGLAGCFILGSREVPCWPMSSAAPYDLRHMPCAGQDWTAAAGQGRAGQGSVPPLACCWCLPKSQVAVRTNSNAAPMPFTGA
jgi:hypothetical protein